MAEEPLDRISEYFPVVPRGKPLSTYLGPLVLLALGIADFALIPVIEFEKAGPLLLWFLLGCVLVIAAIMNLNDVMRARVWKDGLILPGRVIRAPSGPPTGLIWFFLGFVPVVGPLLSFVSGWRGESRNKAEVAVVRDGNTDVMELKAMRHWKYYRDNLDVWILFRRRGKPVFVDIVAPRQFRYVDVPDEMSRWLDEAIAPEYREDVEQRVQDITEREMAKAAKANTRAFRRST